MQYKIIDESPWQILSNAMTIGPSSTGYQLQVAADGRNYTTLFTVGAGITRQITNLSSGSYFRMKGNEGEVTVNWVRSCGGGSGSGGNAGELEPVSEFPVGVPEGTVVALASGDTVGVYQYDGTEWVSVGGDLSDFYTKAETDAEISAATSPIQEQLDDVERVTASALTELHNDILDLSGATPTNSPIIPAINTQAEYEAISGDVKSGDLIQVRGVDINGDNNPESGLFEADVEEEESDGVVRKIISWERRDNVNSVLWSNEDYPWMYANNIRPIDFFESFLVCADVNGEDGAYNGIGFDENGKPVTTHFAPEYDEQTGEVTGITRADTPIGADMSAYYTSAQTDAEITGATSDMKTYVDGRIDGYNTASTITITSTPMQEGYWLDFSEDTMTQNGPEFQMFKTSKSNIVVADTSNLNSGVYGYNQPGFGVFLMGFDSANDAYDIQMIVDLPSSVSLTPQNYNMDIPFIVGTSPVNRVALEWDNLSSSGYPNYFIYNTDTKIGHFAYDLNINEFVPGVVKSDGEITKVKKVTQAEYDAIATPDASTLYIITNS